MAKIDSFGRTRLQQSPSVVKLDGTQCNCLQRNTAQIPCTIWTTTSRLRAAISCAPCFEASRGKAEGAPVAATGPTERPKGSEAAGEPYSLAVCSGHSTESFSALCFVKIRWEFPIFEVLCTRYPAPRTSRMPNLCTVMLRVKSSDTSASTFKFQVSNVPARAPSPTFETSHTIPFLIVSSFHAH